MKSYTDIEQSKVLSKILPLESADMYYLSGNKYDICFGSGVYEEIADWICEGVSRPADIPCWSLAALMNLLPSKFTEKGKYSETTYEIRIRKYALTDDVDIYQIAYGNYKFYEDGNSSWKDIINTGEKENLIDAVFQMICWLKENNKI